jgi:vacuolar protein sorting-associated protein 54
VNAAVHSAPQELASVANNPVSPSFWSGWHALSSSADYGARPTPLPAGTLPEVRLDDFARYLQSVGHKLEEFERDRATAEQWAEQSVNPGTPSSCRAASQCPRPPVPALPPRKTSCPPPLTHAAARVAAESMRASQGQGLAQAMDEVPALFFQDDFDLDRPELWDFLGDVHAEPVRQAALEQLSRHLVRPPEPSGAVLDGRQPAVKTRALHIDSPAGLNIGAGVLLPCLRAMQDAIEVFLVREIAARYDSFFDASGYVQDLGSSVHRLYQQVAEMRARVAALAREAGRGVRVADALQRQQANMLATLETLKVGSSWGPRAFYPGAPAPRNQLPNRGCVVADGVLSVQAMEGVAQAQSALQNIMADAGGVAVDFAAAIDILEVLQGALDNKGLLSLRCFRGLPSQVAGSMQAVEGLMTADFLERSRFGARDACLGAIINRLRAQLSRSNSSEGVAARSHAAPGGGDLPPAAGVLQAAEVALTDAAALHQVAGLLRAEWMTHDSVEEVLLPLAAGLQRVGHLAPAMKALEEASCQQMRDFVA